MKRSQMKKAFTFIERPVLIAILAGALPLVLIGCGAKAPEQTPSATTAPPAAGSTPVAGTPQGKSASDIADAN
jgi:hypothetical protein